MSTSPWNWKGKDRAVGGLLYESGNWGDCIKLLWLKAILAWKKREYGLVRYRDPFAGDVTYPLGKKTVFRLNLFPAEVFQFIREKYLAANRWPSSAAAILEFAAEALVWDADSARRNNWREITGVGVLPDTNAGGGKNDGWSLFAEGNLSRPEKDENTELWLLDPYDFLAEWREVAPSLLERSRRTTVLLYIYNRSGRSPEAFRNYRAFMNRLEDGRPDLPKRLGRTPADAFLPTCYHEMLFLPSEGDCRRESLADLFAELGRISWTVGEAVRRAGEFEG